MNMPEFNRAEAVSRLRSFKMTGDKTAMAQMVARWGKQVNQRLYRIEKAGLQKQSSAWQWAKYDLQKEKPRFSTNANKLEQQSVADLWATAHQLVEQLSSKTGTVTGTKKVGMERLEQGAERLQSRGIDISSDELGNFIQAMGSDYMHLKYIDSNQLLDDYVNMVKNGNLTLKQFTYEYKRFKKKSALESKELYKKVSKNLKNVAKRNTERAAKKRNTNKGSRQKRRK